MACPLPSYRNGSYGQQVGVCVTRPLLGGLECAGRRDSICLPVCWMAGAGGGGGGVAVTAGRALPHRAGGVGGAAARMVV